MHTLWQDIKYGLRQLAKNPGFTAAAVLTLAIGIGANIAMFSVVNAVLLRPLPFEDADRLVVVRQQSKQNGIISGFSYPDFIDWREQHQVLEDFAAFSPAEFEIMENQGARKIDGAVVSGNFFTLLKVSPSLGRSFTPLDEQPDEPVAIISYDFWQSRFDQSRDVLGHTIVLQDRIYTIVGVLPPGFSYPDSIGDAQVWTILDPTHEETRTNRTYCWLKTVGRLRAGISIEQASSLWQGQHQQLVEALGMGDSKILIESLRDTVLGGVQTTLWILYGIVGFILLIVCANVANLCVAKASARDKEIAVRRALGANRLRLLQQFTVESILLSLVGGVVGLLISVWTIAIFQAKITGIVPRANAIGIDPAVLGFGMALSLLVGLALGITAFWFTRRFGLVSVLSERRGTSRQQVRFSNLLVAGQIAMALILSIGMGLMIRSVMQLSSANTGFNGDNLVTFNVDVKQMNEQQRYDFSRDFLQRLTALPGVQSASTDSSLPSSPRATSGPVTVAGYTPPDGKPVRTVCHSISADYFRTLQIPIRQGRDILPQEYEQKTPVVVVNETLARTFWPDRDPIGRELDFCGQTYRIVGIVADMTQGNVRQAKPNHLFLPFDVLGLLSSPELKVVARTTSETGAVIEQARAMLADIDATLPLYDVSTFKTQMNQCISRERFTAAFLTVFALIALALIVVGIYGVVSYAVTQRTREIGIRMAVGARKEGILAMILRQGLTLLLVGIILGTVGALALTRFLSGYLYEVSTTDPMVFATIPVLLAVVALLATYIPARRASRIDPMKALRHE